MKKSTLNFVFMLLGVGFIWLGALGLALCYPQSCPVAWASGISACAMWFTAVNMRDILKDN